MMKIDIICIGRLKEDYLRAAQQEYLKRLGPYARMSVTELPTEQSPEKESAHIERALANGAYPIALAIEGVAISSEDFAARLADIATGGISRIAFIIGGSVGLSPKVLARCPVKLSLSAMTFPHQLARIILLEQIYRAYSIIGNRPYHK